VRSHQPLWFHVDMDAFYAAIEQRDNPDLRGKPVIIGAMPGSRGVVSTCSYEARTFGVHSAMPISQAYRLCPDGTYIRPRMEHYSRESAKIMEEFYDFSPRIIQVSIDEAFIEMTGTGGIFGPPEQAAMKLKNRIRERIGLTITVGAAANRLVAKMASAYQKPDGLTIVPPGTEEEFIRKLELKDLWGVGRKSRQRLEELNIRTVDQLIKIPKDTLGTLFGRAGGEYLYQVCRGIDPGIYDGQIKSHSISNEHTFGIDCKDSQAVEDTLFALAHGIVFRLHRENAQSRTLVLKLRLGDFSTSTIQKSLDHPIRTVEECFDLALELLKSKWDRRNPIRLIGLGFSNVEGTEKVQQGELFDDPEDRRSKVEAAVLELQKKYGDLPISKGRKFIRGTDPDGDGR
jgi:DNA polymerase-4